MLEKAIEKIKAEMEKNKNDDFVPSIGEFLIYYLGINPGAAEKILDLEKSMTNIVPELWKAAEAKKKGRGVVLKDSDVMPIVLKYFGIEGVTPVIIPKSIEVVKAPIAQEKPSVDFNVELDF